jgi:hypothetical protein
MQLSTVFTIVLKFFATSPDLCADVHTDATGAPWTDAIGQTLSRYCKWTGPDAPVWDADVCCTIDGDGAACVTTDSNGRCTHGDKMYCEYGEVIAGGVVCYQPFPDACEAGKCVQAPDGMPPEQAGHSIACCNAALCQEIGVSQQDGCEDIGGTVFVCQNGETDGNGIVTCYDDF